MNLSCEGGVENSVFNNIYHTEFLPINLEVVVQAPLELQFTCI